MGICLNDYIFKITDIVEWCGVAGVVVKEYKKPTDLIQVKFTNHMIVSFYPDGKYYDWHKESCLKLSTKEKLNAQAVETYNERHSVR